MRCSRNVSGGCKCCFPHREGSYITALPIAQFEEPLRGGGKRVEKEGKEGKIEKKGTERTGEKRQEINIQLRPWLYRMRYEDTVHGPDPEIWVGYRHHSGWHFLPYIFGERTSWG